MHQSSDSQSGCLEHKCPAITFEKHSDRRAKMIYLKLSVHFIRLALCLRLSRHAVAMIVFEEFPGSHSARPRSYGLSPGSPAMMTKISFTSSTVQHIPRLILRTRLRS